MATDRPKAIRAADAATTEEHRSESAPVAAAPATDATASGALDA
jgi:hypothetical protein